MRTTDQHIAALAQAYGRLRAVIEIAVSDLRNYEYIRGRIQVADMLADALEVAEKVKENPHEIPD